MRYAEIEIIEIAAETEAAWLFSIDDADKRQIWVPKGLCRVVDEIDGYAVIARWWAYERGLIDAR